MKYAKVSLRSLGLFVLFAFYSMNSWANETARETPGEIEHRFLSCSKLLTLHTLVVKPDGPAKGVVLYLHGFGDRASNHLSLFRAFTERGMMVVAFDYPSHGETQSIWPLGFYGFRSLGNLAVSALRDALSEKEQKLPLIVAGWSTGGLLATRLAQSNFFQSKGWLLQGLILHAPGISVYNFVGDKGWVTSDTLRTEPHPPYDGPIKPASPFCVPLFAINLKLNSWLSQCLSFPATIPTLLVLADDNKDRYVRTPQVKKWYWKELKKGASLWAVQLLGSKHDIDKDSAALVNTISSLFAQSVIEKRTWILLGPPAPVFGGFQTDRK